MAWLCLPLLALAIEAGEPLASALDRLSRGGLNVIYSSAIVTPQMSVQRDPGHGAPEDIAAALLAPHGLALEAVRPGTYVVVRRSDAADSSIAIDVLRASGQPASGVAVRVLPGATSRTTDPAGRASFESLEPGRYDIVAISATGNESKLRNVRVQPHEAWRGTLKLDAAFDSLPEVSVLASRYRADAQSPLSAVELHGEDLRSLPGVGQDALRVTRFLPGTATNGLSARAHVRGGREDELSVWFDGVPLFEPFHFKDIQGLLGILDPGTIGRIDFWSGVTPARFGDSAAGVLDIEPRRYVGEDYAELGLNLLYAQAMTHGRLDAVPLEWLVAVRRSVVKDVLDLSDQRSADPEFLDALVRLSWHFDGGSEIAAGWLQLDDELSGTYADDSEGVHAVYHDATTWLRGTWRLGDARALSAWISHSDRHTSRSGFVESPGNSQGGFDDRKTADATTLRFEYSLGGERRNWLFGAQLREYNALYDFSAIAGFDPLIAGALGRDPALVRDEYVRTEGAAQALYGSVLLDLAPRWKLDLGLRWDRQDYEPGFKSQQWSPRLGVEYAWRPGTHLRVSWGRLSQSERPDELQVTDGDSAYHPTQTASQLVLALDHRLSSELRTRIELFDKRIEQVRPIFENLFDPVTVVPEIKVDRMRTAPLGSDAYGAEWSLNWEPRETWSGWFNYSYSEVTDDFGDFRALRSWDQRHSIVTGLSWTRSAWQLSGSLSWHSGWRQNSLAVQGAPGDEFLVLSPRNEQEWADYVSLDLHASWTRPLPIGSLRLYVDVLNATDSTNPCCTRYRIEVPDDPASLAGKRTGWLPRYGIIGVTWMLP